MSTPPRPGYADLFATPLLTLMLPEHELLNAELRTTILAQQANHPGVALSNMGGWHSDTDLASWGGEASQTLLRAAADLALRFTLDSASPDQPRFRWRVVAWANVSGPGASNALHAHPGAFWSFVYYVDDGGCATDSSLGGELCLLDPRYPMSAMAAPDIYLRAADGQPKLIEQKIRPKAGLLLGFPSWLQHAVRPYLGTGLRISIAINLSVSPL